MDNINIRNILNTYKMFSKRQREILENFAKKKEVYTLDDFQKELQEDVEAKKLLQKIRLIVNREYKKAGVNKSTSNDNNNVEKIELLM